MKTSENFFCSNPKYQFLKFCLLRFVIWYLIFIPLDILKKNVKLAFSLEGNIKYVQNIELLRYASLRNSVFNRKV